jgi:hypothetical protein
LCFAVVAWIAAHPAHAANQVTVNGTLKCLGDSLPLRRAEIVMVDSANDWTDAFDYVMGVSSTSEDGTFSFTGDSGGDSNPHVYLRVFYSDEAFRQSVGDVPRVKVSDELDRPRGEHTPTRDHLVQTPATISFGDVWVGGGNPSDCLLYKQSLDAYDDYAITTGQHHPSGHFNLRRYSGLYTGTPYTYYDRVEWPTNAATWPGARAVQHEFAHSVRHVLDGDYNHWNWDLGRFAYGRIHDSCTNAIEGYAFNEGWAEFWAAQGGCGAVGDTGTNPNVEGDIATLLTTLAACSGVGRNGMVQVLAENPYQIHSYEEFRVRFNQKFPGCIAGRTIQAETGALHGIATEAYFTPYEGNAYLAYWSSDGQGVDFAFDVPTDGYYLVEMRYAAAWGNASRLISVNGATAIANVIFPGTTSWADWRPLQLYVRLTSGHNTLSISFNAATGSQNWLNFDRITIGLPWEDGQRIVGDFNGDGLSDVAILYNYGNGDSALFVLYSTGTGFANPTLVWRSSVGWEWERSKVMAGDFNGDGLSDVAILYNYGNGDSALFVLYSTGTGFASPTLVWRSGVGNWEWERSKVMVGDFNGDGKTDVAILYDYPNMDTALFVLYSTWSGFSPPSLQWRSGVGNWEWSHSKVITGDFNGDGDDDVGILYNYPNMDTALFVLYSNGSGISAPSLQWRSGAGNWEWSRSKVIAGDFNGDRKTDVAILYDYPNMDTALFVLSSTGPGFSPPSLQWRSGAGNWEWSRSKVIAGDFDGDGNADVAILYDYPNMDTALFTLYSYGPGFWGPSLEWRSGAGNWEWVRSKLF